MNISIYRAKKENRMFFRQWIVPTVVLILTVVLNGCMMFSKEVKLEDIPSTAQAVIQSHTSGGTIDKIICEKKEEGKHYYKVEYKKDSRKFELEVDEDGQVLEEEEILTMEDLPPAVQETVKGESAGAEIKELVLETEEGKIFYEVEFEKDGKEYEVKILEDGTILKREKDSSNQEGMGNSRPNQDQVTRLKKSVPEWNAWRKQNPGITPDLQDANLRKANLRKAILQDAVLYRTDLSGAKNLTCEQINSVKSLDKDTEFPDYLEVKITSKNKWTCKEIKKVNR